MSMTLLAVIVLALTAAVVVAIFLVLWRERTSARESRIAVASGVVLAAWAIVATMLARRGFFEQPDPNSVPPIGITLALVLLALAVCLLVSPSLRRLLTNQRNLILLNLWRLVGLVFLMLMANGQMPALWALPAGIGDVIVGAMAPWIAARVDTPQGRRRAIIFNLFGMADLVVAVGLGVMTSPGPASGLSHNADVRAGDALSPRAGADVSRAARLRASRDFLVAAARWPVGASSSRLTWTEPMMSPQAIFGISVLMGFVVWGMIGARYVWPALRDRPRTEALRPLLFLHAFRFVGLAFLVPGVVSSELPPAFAQPAAYGDLATSILALLAIAMLGSRLGTIIVWVFNIVGTVDLLNAFYQGDRMGVGIDTWPAGCRVLHSDGARAASARDARACVPNPGRNRCSGRQVAETPILIGDSRKSLAEFGRNASMANQHVVFITGVSSGVGAMHGSIALTTDLQGLWNKPQSSYRRNDPGGGDATFGCTRRRLGARVSKPFPVVAAALTC